jgi:fermentation-respiration switch protein FrsA (DUF1100 family)
MLGRARFLYDANFSVLLLDLQAHGESEGERITFGYLESADARSGVEFLRQELPGEPVAAIGSSLGGAACVLGRTPIQVDALVLEAVYPDLHQAVKNRLQLHLGPAGAWLAPLLTLQIRPRMGIDVNDLRPVDKIANIQAPVFIVAGALDRRTTVADSQRLFDAAPEPKQLWIIPGARHEDLHRYVGTEYEDRILQFLQLHMSRTS